MPAPSRFVEWINANVGFNPRAGKYSVALSGFVVDDLKDRSSAIRGALASGSLVLEADADVATPSLERNIDMVLWTGSSPKSRQVALAVENKLILAAHGKARKNRLGDIVAFSNHIHNANRRAVVGGLIVVNLSAEYENPDPFADGMTRPTFVMENVVRDTVDIYARLPQRSSAESPHDQPEAFGVFVVRYDGTSAATLVTDAPAPLPGHVLHYDTFLRRLAAQYEERTRP